MTDDTLTLDQLHHLPAVVDLATAARVFGIGRSTVYRLARTGAFPCRVLQVGGSYRVATADLLAAVGLDPAQAATADRQQVAGPQARAEAA
jgi:predicted DNA-binding transcriptional regulator AlpA